MPNVARWWALRYNFVCGYLVFRKPFQLRPAMHAQVGLTAAFVCLWVCMSKKIIGFDDF